MTNRFRCRCGEPLRADDDEAGERVRCRECGKSTTVPDGESFAEVGRPARRRDVDDDPRPRSRSRAAAKRAGGSSNAGVYYLIGGALLLCLIVGLVIAFAFPSKSASEQTLFGEWEPDPFHAAGQPGLIWNTRLAFHPDHTHRISSIVIIDGRWQVVGRDGNQLKVRLVNRIMGMEQNDPPTATITVVDPDHIDFAVNDRSMQLTGRFRRLGSGPPGPRVPPPNGGVPDPQPRAEPGVVPDCEVQWGGTWFKAKVVKAENDRWFIHYVGWDQHWDEWVGRERIRP